MFEERARISREIAAVALFAATALSFLALATYDAQDLSRGTLEGVAAGESAGLRNAAGIVGVYWSAALIFVFGAGSPVAPLCLGLAGWSVLRRRTTRIRRVSLLVGMGSLLALLASLLDLLMEREGLFGSPYHAGGLVGDVLSRTLVSYFATPGAAILLVAGLLVAFLVTSQVSLTLLPSLVARLVSWLGRRVFGAALGYGGRRAFEGREVDAEGPGVCQNEALDEGDSPFRINREVEEGGGPLIVNREPLLSEEALMEPQPVRRQMSESEEEAASSEVVPETGKGPEIREPVGGSSAVVRPRKKKTRSSLPSLDLLDEPVQRQGDVLREGDLLARSRMLEARLQDFGVAGRVVQVLPGPVVTTYEFEPAPGVKVNKVANLSDDLALVMRAISVRIVAPIPGKSVVGIEISNGSSERQKVYLKEILASTEFRNPNKKLSLALGKDILGAPVAADLATIPHLLIAGATGSGKSVGVNGMIVSLLYQKTPEEVKFILIDPKRLELSVYDGVPHLISPVVTDPKQAATALRWAVAEMERRYKLLAEYGVRHIERFNQVVRARGAGGSADDQEPPEPLPYILVIIDELADMMMVAGRDVEESIARLAQMARAAGIHLIVATQRPSVDVLTGLIKANFPARISYRIASKADSRTILDTVGAERLLGQGDMLFLRAGTSRIERIHGAYVSEDEVKRVVDFLRRQGEPAYNDEILTPENEEVEGLADEERDELYDRAVEIVARTGQASISMLQRKLRVGYNRSARMIERMERAGFVGPSDASKPREVHISALDLEHLRESS